MTAIDYATKTTDWTAYADDGLIGQLLMQRGLYENETDDRVRVFLSLRISEIVAEMDRRNELRIERKLDGAPRIWSVP